MQNISQQIEAILFWKAEPVSYKRLAELLNVSREHVLTAVTELEATLTNRGLTLVRNEDEVMLGTSKEMSTLIQQLTKDELVKDLGKAGLETISIILYEGPISRAEIDYIRGVNSQFIIRNLLIRGLVERVDNPKDARSFLYKPTLALLAHLGVSKVEDLPDFVKVKEDLKSFRDQSTNDTIQS